MNADPVEGLLHGAFNQSWYKCGSAAAGSATRHIIADPRKNAGMPLLLGGWGTWYNPPAAMGCIAGMSPWARIVRVGS